MRRPACVVAVFLLLLSGRQSVKTPQGSPSVPPVPQIAPETFPPSIREKVREAYARALTHPLDPQANGQLGMILQAYHPPDSNAEICYRRARAFDPSSFRWAYYLGLVQAEQKKYAEAAATLREALKVNPRYLPAEIKLGQCLFSSGEAEQARSAFERALDHHPQSAQAYFELGRVDEARGDLNAAIQSLRKACELFPHFGAAHYSLALAEQRLGKTDEAREEQALAEKYKYMSPDAADPLMAELRILYTDPNYYLEFGVQNANRGNVEDAVAWHEKALQIDPQLLKAHVNLIALYGRLRAFDRAEEHYRAAIAIDPKNPKAYYDYGVLLTEQGRNSEAKEAFEKALEFDPSDSNARNSLGDLLQREGDLDGALADFRQALVSKPDFPQAHFNLGRVLVNQGNYKEGIPELIKALGTSDDDARPSYLYAVGAAYARSGDPQNGLRYLHMAREQAAMRHESKLLESIDRDLRLLETSGNHD